jgi:hypothetical protein
MDLPLENTNNITTNTKLLNGVLTKQQWIFLEKPLSQAEKHIAAALIDYSATQCKNKIVAHTKDLLIEDDAIVRAEDEQIVRAEDEQIVKVEDEQIVRAEDNIAIISQNAVATNNNVYMEELLDEWDSPELNISVEPTNYTQAKQAKHVEAKLSSPVHIAKKGKNKKAHVVDNVSINRPISQPNTDLFAIGNIYDLWRAKFGNEKLNNIKIDAKFNVDKETKGMKQADKTQYEVLHKQYFDTLNDVLRFLQQEDIMITETDDISHNIFKYNVVEITGIGLMKMAKCVLAHVGYHTKKVSGYKIALTIMTTMQRFIHIVPDLLCTEYKRTKNVIKVSQTMTNDVKYWFEALKKEIVYNMERVSKYSPILFHWSRYKQYIPGEKIKPYLHQTELVDSVYNNIDDGFFIRYGALIGQGKTISALSIASMVKLLRTQDKYKNLRLLFVCNIETVRNQIARFFVNTNIQFAIAMITENGSIRINDHFSGNSRVCIIASPDLAYQMLCEQHNHNNNDDENDKHEYIVFHDEPTVGADETIRYNSNNKI